MIVNVPSQDFYVRLDGNSELFGPLDFRQADAVARDWSDTEKVTPGVTKTGLAELVTFVGNLDRGGDPVKNPSQIFIVYLYIAGKRSLGGKAATYNANGPGCVPNVPSPVSGVLKGQVVHTDINICLNDIPVVFIP